VCERRDVGRDARGVRERLERERLCDAGRDAAGVPLLGVVADCAEASPGTSRAVHAAA
jgi:hypothetical protein